MFKAGQVGLLSIVVSAVLLTSSTALSAGGILLGANAFYDARETKSSSSTGSSTSKQDQTYLGAQAGYITSSGVYLGALYENDTIDTGGTTKPTLTYFAGTLGYIFQNDCFINGSYIPRAEYSQYSGANDKWTLGSGYQIDVGLLHDLAESFYVGVQITHRNIEFKNYNNGSKT